MTAGEKPVLGYWDLRGLCEPIRLLLAYTGTDYEERNFKDRSEWESVKPTLGLDWPNLPYFIDGEVKLSQSTAILRHIARQHGLSGKSEAEMRRIDLVLDQSKDFFNSTFAKMCYDPDFHSKKDEFLSTLPQKLQEYEKFLGTGEWFAGENISFVDFIMYERLDWMRYFNVESVVKCTNLLAFMKRFEKLPKIEKYFNSGRYKKRPILAHMAQWGNKYEERVKHPLENV